MKEQERREKIKALIEDKYGSYIDSIVKESLMQDIHALEQQEQQQELQQERREKIIKWMDVAKCPNCNGDGVVARPDFDGEPILEQCQWCDEKAEIKKLLALDQQEGEYQKIDTSPEKAAERFIDSEIQKLRDVPPADQQEGADFIQAISALEAEIDSCEYEDRKIYNRTDIYNEIAENCKAAINVLKSISTPPAEVSEAAHYNEEDDEYCINHQLIFKKVNGCPKCKTE